MIRRRACVETCSYPQREQKTWLRAVRLPFVGRQQILAAFDGERALAHLRHQRIFLLVQ
ncbi:MULTISPECIES: hypothetical protein [Bradyrhizobium]|uniref:hypothetical protein n=1 Tax=Bradyrhizobium TaxID=374 RepID=UPI0012BC354E|nr:hypothetical protein [Bradyrhizobium japonicum]